MAFILHIFVANYKIKVRKRGAIGRKGVHRAKGSEYPIVDLPSGVVALQEVVQSYRVTKEGLL